MDRLEIVGISILILNLGLTYWAFQKPQYFAKWQLRIGDLNNGEWHRLLSSGFIHVDWTHFFFNMFSLFIFGGSVERELGPFLMALLYFASLLGGNLLAWFYHRNDMEYRAVGASGAISGLIFGAIALFPGMQLALLFLPFVFPAWIYGLLFLLYTMYGIGKQHDNIGHEAHLGGAVIGLLITLLMVPSLVETNPMTILYLAVPSVVFLIILFYRPQLLNQVLAKPSDNYGVEDLYREKRKSQEDELNRILSKIKEQGESSLSQSERDFLQNNF